MTEKDYQQRIDDLQSDLLQNSELISTLNDLIEYSHKRERKKQLSLLIVIIVAMVAGFAGGTVCSMFYNAHQEKATDPAGENISFGEEFHKIDERFNNFGEFNENGEFIVDLKSEHTEPTIGGKTYGKDFLTPSANTKNAVHYRLKTKAEVHYDELSKANQKKYDDLYDFCVTAGISDPTKENIAFNTRDGKGLKWHLTASINRDVVGSKYYVEPERRGDTL